MDTDHFLTEPSFIKNQQYVKQQIYTYDPLYINLQAGYWDSGSTHAFGTVVL